MNTEKPNTLEVCAIKLDTKKLRAYYATEKVGSGKSEYVRHESVKEVVLTKTEKRYLKTLLTQTNWALIRVLGPDCIVKRTVEKYTHDVYYEIDGEYERWTCHRPYPGSGRTIFDSKWREIESILENAIRRSD